MNSAKTQDLDVSFEQFVRDAGRVPSRRLGGDERPVVCVQGLGFVGAAMALAVARAADTTGRPYFNVIGVDLPSPAGSARIEAINAGRFPFSATDGNLVTETAAAWKEGNLVATSNPVAYALASVVVVDINCDVLMDETGYRAGVEPFVAGIRAMAARIRPGTLVIVETTVPPGTCDKIVEPEMARVFQERGLPEDAFLLAHSYERVMPGPDYYDSIVNFWRVFAGQTEEAGDECADFLGKVVNVAEFPLTRLKSTIASETAKVLENSFRATTIAFIDEWGRFAERAGIDLFEVIDAIRIRPTHVNMRQPGFGVGGYCLTKDPLLPGLAARDLLDLPGLEFPFSEQAVEVNRRMPLASLDRLEALLGGTLRDKRILLMGVSYRSDVGDTRNSPSEVFYRAAVARGAEVVLHDPLVGHWGELGLDVASDLPELGSGSAFHAVVFAVAHAEYGDLHFPQWLCGHQPVILDANRVLTDQQMLDVRAEGCVLASIGRGDK
jgi:UDP-N-acetyl-D-glucosamine dehydrogenase